MRLHQCVISGSAALWFFDRSAQWQPGDLDLYTPRSQWDDVILYLTTAEGARVALDQPEDHAVPGHYTSNHGIAGVARIVTRKGRINVIRSEKDTALWPVAFFWTDLLKNVIGPDQAISTTWPLLAQRKGVLVPRMLSDKETIAVAKYVQRGYAFDVSPNLLCVPEREDCGRWRCPHRVRTFTDRGCLHVSFDVLAITDGMDLFDSRSQSTVVGWKVGGEKCSPQCRGLPVDGPLILSGSPEEILDWSLMADAIVDNGIHGLLMPMR